MSDIMSDHDNSSLPNWVRETLRAPVTSTAVARSSIMEQVLHAPKPRRVSAPMRPSRWVRRGLLAPVRGLMTTVVMTTVLMFRVGLGSGNLSGVELAARVLGDSVVPVAATANMLAHGAFSSVAQHAGAAGNAESGRAVGAHDSAGGVRFMDTLRIVELVIRGSSVHAASVIGEFNRWRRGVTPLVAAGDNEWKATVLVPRDVLSVTYLVNNAQLVPTVISTAPRIN
jgi:hypothetical protein